MTNYTVRRGATLSLYLEAIIGDISTVSNPVAKIAPQPVSARVAAFQGASPATTPPLTLTVIAQSTSPGVDPTTGLAIAPGWYVTLSAAQSATLPVGVYVVDMAFQVATAEFVSEQVTVQVDNAASLP